MKLFIALVLIDLQKRQGYIGLFTTSSETQAPGHNLGNRLASKSPHIIRWHILELLFYWLRQNVQ